MKYIIDEIELITFKQNVILYNSCGQKNVVENFLKDKQPVEEIESGIVQGDFGYYLGDRLTKYQGEKVKLYIQKAGEK